MDAARAVLLERAVVAAERDGRPVGVHELAGEVAEAVSASLANHDPTAELLLDVACSACETSWQSVLDVAAFVWTEPAAQAERLLQDVHLLARAYGWSEEQTLALGNSRRTAYSPWRAHERLPGTAGRTADGRPAGSRAAAAVPLRAGCPGRSRCRGALRGAALRQGSAS